MPADVFLSYARAASAAPVRAVADALRAAGVSVFLDEREIPYGESIPDRVIDGLLGACVVVVFAEAVYFTRWYCQLEYDVALAGFRRLVEQGAPEAERVTALGHLVIALPAGAVRDAELDALPPALRQTDWVPADEVSALVALVQHRLATVASASLRGRIGTVLDTAEIAALFTRRASLPQPLRLAAMAGGPPLPARVPSGARASLRERFVGRADDLWRLHDTLAPAGTTTGRAARAGALRGVGGVGKTQLAAEYLYRYGPRHYTGGVFWLDAGQPVAEQHHAVLRALGVALPELPVLREQVGANRVAAVLYERLADAFRSIPLERPVLVIVDDVPEPEAGGAPPPLETWCPAPDAVAYLVTSQMLVGFANGSVCTEVPLDVLAPDDAVAVLTGAGVDRAALDAPDWDRIAAWVGYLPLALSVLHSAMQSNVEPLSPQQALAAITLNRSITGELDEAIDALRVSVPVGALRGITEAFLLSYERLPSTTRAAARLLAQCGPEPLPLVLADALLGTQRASARDRALLKTRAFVIPARAGGPRTDVALFGVMHRVLADFLRARADQEGSAVVDETTVLEALLTIMTPAACRDPAQWPLLALCAPHARRMAVAGAVDDRVGPEQIVDAALSVGLYRSAQGDARDAESAYRIALDTATRRLGPDDAHTLTSASNLADARRAEGDLAEALALEESVLAARTRVLGPEHPDTLTSMSNLAVTLGALGDRFRARMLQMRVLDVRVSMLGPRHPDTLAVMSNLAATLAALGDHAGARAMKEQVLATRVAVLGPEHPDTLNSKNNLAETLVAQGDLDGARAMQEEVVEALTRTLGAEHPRTLMSRSNLAGTRYAQGDRVGARAMETEVLAARERVLGPEHPDTLASRTHVARLLGEAGDLAGARVQLERVLAARARLHGADAAVTVRAALQLARVLVKAGDHAEAARVVSRAHDAVRATRNLPDALRGELEAQYAALWDGNGASGTAG